MSAEIVDIANGIITAKVSGKLKQPELAAAQKAMAEILRQQGKMRILILTENFEGWDKGGNWGDMSFLHAYDSQMERMAIVGDEKWKGLTMMFTGTGFRRCVIEYFAPEDAAKAKAWLMEKS